MSEIATGLLDAFAEDAVKELLDLRPWMQDKTFRLLTKPADVSDYVDKLIESGICGLDLETTSLNTRVKPDGTPYAEIVGVCLALSPNDGAYIPVKHEDKEFNVELKFVLQQLRRLIFNCVCVYHNFKYDGQVLRNYGIVIEDDNLFEDTYLMAAVEDASRREKGLKYLSEKLIKRPMIDISELGIAGSKKSVVAFDMVPPQNALYYGASDAMNTLGLYLYFKKKINEQDPEGKNGPWYIYKIEKRCLFVTMEMERNTVLIDKEYLRGLRFDIQERMKKLLKDIYSIAGREFDINSPKQLGPLLYEELKIRYPTKEKTASGQYKTDEKTLILIEREAPIVRKILSYRGYTKLVGTYIDNFINNIDEEDNAKFQLNQVRADTGRFSASGGAGLDKDGYCGVNCQNIPTWDKNDPDSVDVRRALIARPGHKILSVDYSGEELRISANLSREPKWIHEFNEGEADLHTATGRIVYGRDKISKIERGLAKTLNFHTIYGGGAGGFAMRAKIPVDTAKKMLFNFFKKYDRLALWLKTEAKRAKKRGYSKTAFGRRRSLKEFYSSTDKKVQSRGDRCAINSSVQGSGADIIKTALYRVWKWIHTNGFTDDDIRILMPIHDEIVYEVKEDKLDYFVKNLTEIMVLRDITERLRWPVPLEVDAEYGDSLSVDHDYFKEHKKEEVQSKPESAPLPEEAPKVKFEPESVKETTNIKEEKKPITEIPEPSEKEEKKDSEADSKIQHYSSEQGEKDGSQYINFSITLGGAEGGTKESEGISEDKIDEKALSNEDLKDKLDDKGFFIHTVRSTDLIESMHLRDILEILQEYDNMFAGPKCRIKLVASDGTVLHKIYKRISIDAFESLCLWHNL